MNLLTFIRRLGRLLLLLCCCWLLTGPQLLLQLGAWSWMVASYSQESSIEQAFADTFGGERPCELCKLITAVDAEQETTPIKESTEVKSLKLLLGQAERLSLAPTYFIAAKRGNSDQSGRLRHSDVPIPPPRHV
ncbi:hypothetical protein [Lentimonas sp. CC10]|uniref:hypothetical protein n=1 Tax=Lentimonas sp. CC10 TaxID=2676095 RepID=UPI001A7F06AA|nr:hypothetical protein [Lentimonas sp. CC10]